MNKRASLPILSALSVLALAALACQFSLPTNREAIIPSGVLVTETREVSGFDQVELASFGEVILLQGETESLVIEADDNLLPYVETVVQSGKLILRFSDTPRLDILNQADPTLRFTLTVRDLSSLEVTGLGSMTCEALEAGDLSLAITGSGNIHIGSLTADTLAVRISGLGDVELAGRVESQEIQISGAGNYSAMDLESASAAITISGLGDSTVWVRDSLVVTLTGAGNVQYYGSPSVSQTTTGLGSVDSLGER